MIRPAELDVLPAGYQTLFDRAVERLAQDERIRAVWLGGSFGRGTADRASDLDLLVAVHDDAYDDFVGSWASWLAGVTPTVISAGVPFVDGAFYSVTPGFERFDVVVERASAVASTSHRARVVVFDKDDLDRQVPATEAGPGPSPAVVASLITEYFRISAVETILVRDDWLLAREHLHVVSSLLYRLFVESNAPLPMMGVKQWSTKLDEAQRAVLLSLPTSAGDVGELRVAHLAGASAFVTNAEALAGRLEVAWPMALEDAAAAHLRRYLEIEDPYPRAAAVLAV